MQKELNKFNAMERAKQIRENLTTKLSGTVVKEEQEIKAEVDKLHLSYLDEKFNENFNTVASIVYKAQLSDEGLSKFWKIVNKNLI